MRGDRFSIFGEFRSLCKIWTNSYGTIYQDRKNHLRLSSLDYPPREIKPKKLDTEPVRSQLRGDFLLGRDQAE
ncbi:hypothetical protein F2Q70_00017642 [Brassica cretica]|uniref:Uncharacterized protein n=1 Tax=Brassica cretica TaxID=69181 RepID=A0A8S9HQI5_BRACR|nr:hypothetical protein F2Q70_00017642 [Brassica cretica]